MVQSHYIIFVLAVVHHGVEGMIQCQSVGNLNLSVNDTAQIGDEIHDFETEIQLVSDCDHFNISSNGTTLLLNRKLRNPCIDKNTLGCDILCELQGSSNSRPLVVVIHKVDIHLPSFPSDQYAVNITELSPEDTEVFVFNSSDSSRATDSDCTSPVTYTIAQSDGGNFSLPNTITGKVVTNGTVLYDKGRTYTLIMRAESTGRYASTTLVITVLDVDDKNPAFTDVTYHLNVTEEEISSHALSTTPPVIGFDQDIGINATVLYSFNGLTTTNKYFTINTSTGLLTQIAPFDRENTSTWSTEINCYQFDDHSKRASAYITVTVLDINDHLPVFYTESFQTTLTEHSVGQVASVQAIDEDEGVNAVIYYRIVQGNDAFSIDKTSGDIIVKAPELLDRERTENLTILVQAFDTVGNVSAENGSVVVHLLDLNDNNPVFEQDPYPILFNDSHQGSVIGTIVANDADVPGTDNSNVTYEVVDTWSVNSGTGSQFPLSLDTLSGEITITNIVTVGTVYNMFVRACDNPISIRDRRCNSARVQAVYSLNTTVSVDISLNTTVYENVPIGTIMERLTVIGDTYNITIADFIVDQQSHMLRTNTLLDRETKDSYTFEILVLSHLYGIVGNISVTVTILDMNDHQPVFVQQEYFFAIPLQGEDDVFLGTLKSEDNDLGENSDLIYSLNRNTLSELFTVDPNFGNLTLSRQWWDTVQRQSMYALTVNVQDNGTPKLQSSAQVFVSYMELLDNTSVVMFVDESVDVISANIQQIQRELATILGVTKITIESVQEATAQHSHIRSEIHISARDEHDEAVLSIDIARSMVDMWYSVQSLFRAPFVTGIDNSDTGIRVAEIALIVVGGAIFLGGVIAIPLVCKQWERHIKEHQLYDHLRRPSTMYDSQELHMNFTEENPRSQFSSFRSAPRKEATSAIGGSFGLGYISPVFDDDESTAPKTPTWGTSDQPRIPRWSTTDSLKDVMASLEDLSKRLNAEDNISGVTELSRSRRSLVSNKSESGPPPDGMKLADWHTIDQNNSEYITVVAHYPLEDATNTNCDEYKYNDDVVTLKPKECHKSEMGNGKVSNSLHIERVINRSEESTAF